MYLSIITSAYTRENVRDSIIWMEPKTLHINSDYVYIVALTERTTIKQGWLTQILQLACTKSEPNGVSSHKGSLKDECWTWFLKRAKNLWKVTLFLVSLQYQMFTCTTSPTNAASNPQSIVDESIIL